MKVNKALQALLNDPKFEVAVAIANGMIEEYNEQGNRIVDGDVSKTALNTAHVSGKAKGIQEFFERLRGEAVKEEVKEESNE